MKEEKTFTEAEAQRHFAVQFNTKTWELLDQNQRTPEENELMVDYAHASLAHWRVAGTGLHHQRGEWMLAHVYTVLGNASLALEHANRCLALTEQHKDLMEDFDFAFAYEAMARAHALTKDQTESQKFIDMAGQAGDRIKDKEDREIFLGDFNGGNWYGMK